MSGALPISHQSLYRVSQQAAQLGVSYWSVDLVGHTNCIRN